MTKEEIINFKGRTLKVIEVMNTISAEEIEFNKWSNEALCLEAVKQDGYSLRYVKEKKIFIKLLKK